MAIQDFLAGGFYGKLGDIVGQRWGNQRIARQYVVPKDPKSEKQVAWRSKFAAGIKATQLANAMDWDTPIFTDVNSSKQNARQSTALRLLQDDVTGLALIPLTPYGVSAPNVVTTFEYLTLSDGGLYARLGDFEFDTAIAIYVVVGSTTVYPSLDNCTFFKCTWNTEYQLLEIPSDFASYITEGATLRLCSTSVDTTAADYVCSDVLTATEYVKTTVTLTADDMTLSQDAQYIYVTISAYSDISAEGSVVPDFRLENLFSGVTDRIVSDFESIGILNHHIVMRWQKDDEDLAPLLCHYLVPDSSSGYVASISSLSITGIFHDYTIDASLRFYSIDLCVIKEDTDDNDYESYAKEHGYSLIIAKGTTITLNNNYAPFVPSAGYKYGAFTDFTANFSAIGNEQLFFLPALCNYNLVPLSSEGNPGLYPVWVSAEEDGYVEFVQSSGYEFTTAVKEYCRLNETGGYMLFTSYPGLVAVWVRYAETYSFYTEGATYLLTGALSASEDPLPTQRSDVENTVTVDSATNLVTFTIKSDLYCPADNVYDISVLDNPYAELRFGEATTEDYSATVDLLVTESDIDAGYLDISFSVTDEELAAYVLDKSSVSFQFSNQLYFVDSPVSLFYVFDADIPLVYGRYDGFSLIKFTVVS